VSTWVWIVVAVVVVVLLVVAVLAARRARVRRGLRSRFGSEYDRTVETRGRRRQAERELAARAQRREQLEIRPLSPAARDRYGEEWRAVQGRFVDQPERSVDEADALVARVMRDRGYPVDDFDTQAELVSVDHPDVVENYRAAHQIHEKNQDHRASVGELREAVVRYRSLFEELLTDGSDGDAAQSRRDSSEQRDKTVGQPAGGTDVGSRTAAGGGQSSEAEQSSQTAPPEPAADELQADPVLVPSADKYRARWDAIQKRFVDEPRGAVEQADALVTEVVHELAETFTAERAALERQWSQGDQTSTERLRLALQRYRSFFNRLLSQ
jgi:hypothetical protein